MVELETNSSKKISYIFDLKFYHVFLVKFEYWFHLISCSQHLTLENYATWTEKSSFVYEKEKKYLEKTVVNIYV